MKLVRLATLYFDTDETEFLKQTWLVKVGDIFVKSHPIGKALDISLCLMSRRNQTVFAYIRSRLTA